MADTSSNPESSDPRSSASSFDEGAFDEGTDYDPEAGAPPWTDRANDPMEGVSPSLAIDAARIWVQRHQKASMLGAFAVGVFVGAILRD